MQSVYKVAIDFAVLRRVDSGRLDLDRNVRIERADFPPSGVYSPIRDRRPEGGFEMRLEDLLRAAILDSDGTACDVLLKLVSPAEVTRDLRSLGVSGMVVATTEAEMARGPRVQYRNWATPDSTLDLLAALPAGRGLEASSRSKLLGWMAETPIGLHRLKGALPEGTAVAHKTGTSGTRAGRTAATNDAGIVTLPDGRHLLIAVYVSDSPASLSVRKRGRTRRSRAPSGTARLGRRVRRRAETPGHDDDAVRASPEGAPVEVSPDRFDTESAGSVEGAQRGGIPRPRDERGRNGFRRASRGLRSRYRYRACQKIVYDRSGNQASSM